MLNVYTPCSGDVDVEFQQRVAGTLIEGSSGQLAVPGCSSWLLLRTSSAWLISNEIYVNAEETLLSRVCSSVRCCWFYAALQGSRASPDLQAIREAADSKAANRNNPRVNLFQQQQNMVEAAQEPGSSGADASSSSSGSQQPLTLWSTQYGYAVLGGVDPEASQLEAGAQQPKLHPTRDFKQGEVYDPAVSHT